MSRRSKITMIVAAGLLLLGIIICLISSAVASGTDVKLFRQVKNKDGNFVSSYDDFSDSIKKITIDLNYADVNVIGGADKLKIELINFPTENFKLTSSATTVKLTEQSGLSIGLGLDFEGLRDVIHSVEFQGKRRTVNIYVNDGMGLEIFDLKVYSGNLLVKDCNFDAKYTIKLDYGSLKISDTSSTNSIYADILEGNIDVSGGTIGSLTAMLGKGYESIDKADVTVVNASIDKGYFKYLTGGDALLSCVIRLDSGDGRVRFNDDIYENGKFSQGVKYTGNSSVVQKELTVNIKSGNILISK